MGWIEEAWEETLLIPPPFVLPMWARGRNQETAAFSKSQRGVNRAGVLPRTEASTLQRQDANTGHRSSGAPPSDAEKKEEGRQASEV